MTRDAIEDRPARWLLLLHQLPAKPAYQRVKLWRRLQSLGAVAIKHAVNALPANDQTREDFEWLLKEIRDSGGEGLICEARLVDGLSDDEVEAMFNAAREADFDALAKEARALGDQAADATAAELRGRVARLRSEVARIAAIDFFGANGREAVDGRLAGLENTPGKEAEMQRDSSPEQTDLRDRDTMNGRVWVTRRDVYIDRIASAWLIKRFIDPRATFKFVPGKGYTPRPGEIRFDMFEAEITHEGDRCTFEVLLMKAGLDDPALAAIAEIVHDIDLKDSKFGREETGGIAHLVTGLCTANKHDETRIERGATMLDDLHAYFSRRRT